MLHASAMYVQTARCLFSFLPAQMNAAVAGNIILPKAVAIYASLFKVAPASPVHGGLEKYSEAQHLRYKRARDVDFFLTLHPL
jgi:hypothetical protein